MNPQERSDVFARAGGVSLSVLRDRRKGRFAGGGHRDRAVKMQSGDMGAGGTREAGLVQTRVLDGLAALVCGKKEVAWLC
jgi:hypothetical protein